MTAPPPDLSREIHVAAGRVDVLHRLALAVAPRDAVTTGPIGLGLRVGVETARTLRTRPRRRADGTPVDPGLRFPAAPLCPGAAFVLRHSAWTPSVVTVRIDDPARRWVPRRFAVPLWTATEVEAADALPPSAPVPAGSRLLRPWLLPGAAYHPPAGSTGVRLRVTRGGTPVRWVRAEAFGVGGVRVAWGHGDEHGEVLLIVADTGALPPPAPTTLDVALRVHVPPRPAVGAVDPLDPLSDLAIEQVTRSAAPPTGQDLDNGLLRGITPPLGHVAGPDVVIPLTVGTVTLMAHVIP